MRTQLASALVVSALAACGQSALVHKTPDSATKAGSMKGQRSATGASASAPWPPSVDHEPLSSQYLVHKPGGPIELRAMGSTASLVLVPRAQHTLYDPALELIWFIDEDRLGVFDLRTPQERPTIIARGVPDTLSRISIEHPAVLAETQDSCDLEFLSLAWEPRPTVTGGDPPPPKLRIENTAWMEAQRSRVPRKVSASREFDERVKLPQRVCDCEEKRRCGAATSLGSLPLQLVLTRERMGGDCMHRACLLRDPKSGSYAQPPGASKWGSAEEIEAGSCGLFRFDESGTAFFLDTQLCAQGHACLDVGGRPLGWRLPGAVVGAP